MRHPSTIITATALLTAATAQHRSVPGQSVPRTRSAIDATPRRGSDHGEPRRSAQQLTLFLAGVTAEEYLAWVHDPEPPALGSHLKSVTARAQPRGRRVDVELIWDGAPPALRDAAIAAGLPLTPHVVTLRPTGL